VEGNATRIKDVIALVAGGGGIGVVEGIAEAGATMVMHEPAAVAVVAEFAMVVCEGVAAEADSVHTADGVVLGIDTVVAKWAASGIKSDVGVGVAKAVSAATVFVPFAELVAAWVERKIVAIETAGIGLRIDTLVIKGGVSWIGHEAAVADVSCTIRKRTAVADAACAVAIIGGVVIAVCGVVVSAIVAAV
jgi:hypothetical protein